MSDMTTLCGVTRTLANLASTPIQICTLEGQVTLMGTVSPTTSDGLAEVIMRNKSLPSIVLDLASALDPIVDVDSSYQAQHVCGITSARDVYCWGSGSYGVLGDAGSSHNRWADVVAGSRARASRPATEDLRVPPPPRHTAGAMRATTTSAMPLGIGMPDPRRHRPPLWRLHLDSWLDLWDTGDDNDGHPDDLDAFPTDACAHLDHDLDGARTRSCRATRPC